MEKKKAVLIFAAAGTLLASGCTVRTYPLIRDRVDQDLSGGNRGFLMGTPAAGAPRKTTRTTHAVEMEMGAPLKFERRSAMYETQSAPAAPTDEGSGAPEISEAPVPETVETPHERFEDYKVQKGDTLQKISDKFFGTTKRWYTIYQANKDTLKTPDRIYPGRTIRIPMGPAARDAQKIK